MLEQRDMTLLETALETDFVPSLPQLMDLTPPADQQQRKNLSHAFSAFALCRIAEIKVKEAAEAVVDDFDDFGIDAIYYHGPSETLYIIQGKLKASETFSQAEANAFCQGVRKLIKQDFSGFNDHVINRQTEIEGALESCSHIDLVIAHVGAGISNHAKKAVEDLLADEDHGEERLSAHVIDYDAARVVADLQEAKAYHRIDVTLTLQHWSCVAGTRKTYFGLVSLNELVQLHKTNGKALYAKNIRTFLGHTTAVNKAIRDTLATAPIDFMYLNNGVTALCEQIEPKNGSRSKKQFKIRGLSVINGAQTIASTARFFTESTENDISSAQVMVTLIMAANDGPFGKAVTRARNHQNPVLLANFAALDDEQERLRRELAYLDIQYVYKAEGPDGSHDPMRIRIDEAAQALALLQTDPRFAVWLKKEPAQLLNTEAAAYRVLFSPNLKGIELANAVRVLRYVQSRASIEAIVARGPERLTYKHGVFALGFVLAKRLKDAVGGAVLIDEEKLRSELSPMFDALRQELWNKTDPRTMMKGPLAIFRNQTDTVPLLRDVMTEHYGLSADPAIGHIASQSRPGQQYPEALFKYLADKAPQIGNLT